VLHFSNKEVAEKYESLVEQDRDVLRQQVYSGKLSNITPAMAEAMVKGGSNLIKVKAPAPAAKPATGTSKP
jgi:hypothetical protein